uniref:Importin N-terminal domain-containing protein n=1 Tax=Heterorhabditis bacteriophora TaxID=37862 RepID=A0A1I7XCA9_HETBA
MYTGTAVKLYEFLTMRGCEEVSTLLMEFVNIVISRYLTMPHHMNEMSRTWVQSREILRIVCSSPSDPDILLTLLATILDIKLKFVQTWTGDRVDRNMLFVCYALDQMDDFVRRVNQRVQQNQRREIFALSY